MPADGALQVEIVYARPDEQAVVALSVPRGTTAEQAITLSGFAHRFPELGSSPHVIGVYGRVVAGNTELREGDRVELYRPLVADPKQARRRRVAQKP